MTATPASRPNHEWHRRGLRSPAEIDALVEARLVHHTDIDEPTYADFLRDPAA
ncbi:hypothetical protein [Curtobacterium sp. 9128]|uniref:hypothetical protein n=1 Tax=Curtobacterium sp. 9128 TaxID=1793722 RepID=UPI0016427E9F|nr:hypothetical protein [Curtobacterium sp. 9128]